MKKKKNKRQGKKWEKKQSKVSFNWRISETREKHFRSDSFSFALSLSVCLYLLRMYLKIAINKFVWHEFQSHPQWVLFPITFNLCHYILRDKFFSSFPLRLERHSFCFALVWKKTSITSSSSSSFFIDNFLLSPFFFPASLYIASSAPSSSRDFLCLSFPSSCSSSISSPSQWLISSSSVSFCLFFVFPDWLSLGLTRKVVRGFNEKMLPKKLYFVVRHENFSLGQITRKIRWDRYTGKIILSCLPVSYSEGEGRQEERGRRTKKRRRRRKEQEASCSHFCISCSHSVLLDIIIISVLLVLLLLPHHLPHHLKSTQSSRSDRLPSFFTTDTTRGWHKKECSCSRYKSLYAAQIPLPFLVIRIFFSRQTDWSECSFPTKESSSSMLMKRIECLSLETDKRRGKKQREVEREREKVSQFPWDSHICSPEGFLFSSHRHQRRHTDVRVRQRRDRQTKSFMSFLIIIFIVDEV